MSKLSYLHTRFKGGNRAAFEFTRTCTHSPHVLKLNIGFTHNRIIATGDTCYVTRVLISKPFVSVPGLFLLRRGINLRSINTNLRDILKVYFRMRVIFMTPWCDYSSYPANGKQLTSAKHNNARTPHKSVIGFRYTDIVSDTNIFCSVGSHLGVGVCTKTSAADTHLSEADCDAFFCTCGGGRPSSARFSHGFRSIHSRT